MTEARMDAWRADERARYERISARNPGALGTQMIERMLADMRFRAAIPAHAQRMYADALGNLWLQAYQLPGHDGPSTWLVFDTDGQWLGTVDMPAAFTVNEIGPDYVLGVARDSLDVQYVRMYRLEKPGG
jgi:hypothetical protein